MMHCLFLLQTVSVKVLINRENENKHFLNVLSQQVENMNHQKEKKNHLQQNSAVGGRRGRRGSLQNMQNLNWKRSNQNYLKKNLM